MGTEPEPRENLSSGHIPGSINLPFQELILNSNKCIKETKEIRRIFINHGITFEKPIIGSCGSGITASIIAFCLHLIGQREYSVYDGSWAEWGSHKDSPIHREN